MRDESTIPAVLRKKLPPNLEQIRNGHYDKDHPDYSIHVYLKENDIKVTEEGSEIVAFLRRKNILITGATGFLGKLLVEKLLRCCKDIGTIYIIIRAKKGKSPQERVNEYLDNWVFYRLSEIHPNYKEKVVGIPGDFEQDGLGLSEESKSILREKVNIIYHVAATIRFDEKLKKAVKVNLRGTLEMINLAKECNKLDVFVHMSTAYANCHEKVIKEEFCPPHLDPYKLMHLAEELTNEEAEKITPGLLGSVPNTYAFTKQITEDIIRRECVGMPVCIHRPSIVIAAVREPTKSWVDNIFGPVGLIQGAAMGLVHVMIGNPNGTCDMVPADYVINSCIATSYKVAKQRQLDNIPIYNYTLAKENPLYWKNLGITGLSGYKVSSAFIIMKGFHRFTSCYFWYVFLNFFLHTIPAYIVDFAAASFGKQPILKNAYKKIDKFVDVLSHFTLNEWTFDNTNTRKLWAELNEIDKKNFSFDMATINWNEYFETYMVALREFLMFDFLDSLEAGRLLRLKIDVIFYVVVTLLVGSSIYFLFNTIFFFIPLIFISIILFYQLTSNN